MEIKHQPKLSFFGVDIVNLNFSSTTPFDSEGKIELSIDPKLFFFKDDPNAFKIIMGVNLTSIGFFELSLTAIGSFQIEGEVDEKVRGSFLNTNSPAIMFPYVRAFISILTTNMGIATKSIILPPHFFKGEIPVIPEEEIVKRKPETE